MQQAVAGGQLQQATVVEQQTVVMEKETSAGNDGFKDASKMSSCVDIEPQPQPQRSPPSGFWSCLYRALDVCDHLGERIADFLGITSPRFQYVIDEHNRIEKRKKEKVHLPQPTVLHSERSKIAGGHISILQEVLQLRTGLSVVFSGNIAP